MRQRLALWLWEVLARPLIDRLEKKIEYHAMVLERRLLTEMSKDAGDLRLQMDRLQMAIALFSANYTETSIKQHGNMLKIKEQLETQATNREYEAVHFAAEKLVLDRDFWKQARVEARIAAVMDWSKIYLAKNGWPIPDDLKLRNLVVAKLEQIVERKVGPTQ